MASAGEGFLMGDWAELPSDLLTLIVKRIDLYEDFVGFGGVCRSWRSIAVKENFNHSPQIPWLMLGEGGGGDNNNLRGFVSLTKGGMIRRVELPGARTWRGCFSSKGWLITTNAANDMKLLHPLTRVSIPLPHPRTFKYYPCYSHSMLLHRAVLSASPSVTEDYVLMVIFRGFYVGFWKPGNTIWTLIDETEQHPCWKRDVVYYKDQFYVINSKGHLLLCNTNSCTSQMVGQIHQVTVEQRQVYLVECGGELLVVWGSVIFCLEFNGYVKSELYFRVLRFDSTDFNNECQQIDDFGGRSIFVGYGASASAVSACVAGTRSNCIYFSEEGYVKQYTLDRIQYNGTEVYNWGYQTRQRVSKHTVFRKEKQQPIWVSPSF